MMESQILQKPIRKTIRLKDYDYSQAGGYFVTICTKEGKLFFENDAIRKITEESWLEIPKHFENAELDVFIIMPNHLHGIVVINDVGTRFIVSDGGFDKSNPYKIKNNPMLQDKITLGEIILFYKGKTSSLIRKNGFPDFQWQGKFYEHIIRSKKSLNNIRQYIAENPLRWELDAENPDNWKYGKKIDINKYYKDIFEM